MVNCILFCIIILFFHTCLILFAFSLTYTPCRDCAGVEYLNITMYENQTDPEIPPANSTDVIIINIQSINDPPIPFAAYNGKLLLMDDITEPIVVGILFICLFGHNQSIVLNSNLYIKHGFIYPANEIKTGCIYTFSNLTKKKNLVCHNLKYLFAAILDVQSQSFLY